LLVPALRVQLSHDFSRSCCVEHSWSARATCAINVDLNRFICLRFFIGIVRVGDAVEIKAKYYIIIIVNKLPLQVDGLRLLTAREHAQRTLVVPCRRSRRAISGVHGRRQHERARDSGRGKEGACMDSSRRASGDLRRAHRPFYPPTPWCVLRASVRASRRAAGRGRNGPRRCPARSRWAGSRSRSPSAPSRPAPADCLTAAARPDNCGRCRVRRPVFSACRGAQERFERGP
jgi:hypothetical protein